MPSLQSFQFIHSSHVCVYLHCSCSFKIKTTQINANRPCERILNIYNTKMWCYECCVSEFLLKTAMNKAIHFKREISSETLYCARSAFIGNAHLIFLIL